MNFDSGFFLLSAFFLGGFALLGGLAALYQVARIRRELLRLKRTCALQETAILSLRGALSILSTGELGQEQRQEMMERRIRDLADRQQSLLMRDPETRPYAQAIRMVQKGASVQDVMEHCCLTQGEAELIVSLHGDPGNRI